MQADSDREEEVAVMVVAMSDDDDDSEPQGASEHQADEQADEISVAMEGDSVSAAAPDTWMEPVEAGGDASYFSGPVAIVLDVQYLASEFSIPATASFGRFEDAVSLRCGGGTICARFACDLEADGEPLPSRVRLHDALRTHGYELVLTPPRPLSGMPGATDLDITCCILEAARAPPPSANVIALVVGDCDFSAVLGRVLAAPPPPLALPPAPADAPGGTSEGCASPAHSTGMQSTGRQSTGHGLVSPPLRATGGESSSAPPEGLRACVLISEREATAPRLKSAAGGSSSSAARAAALSRPATRHLDLFAMLPALVPGIDLRDAKLRRERRQRLQSETAARVMQKEKQAESTRPGRTPCPKLPTACVHASSLLAVPCVWYR